MIVFVRSPWVVYVFLITLVPHMIVHPILSTLKAIHGKRGTCTPALHVRAPCVCVCGCPCRVSCVVCVCACVRVRMRVRVYVVLRARFSALVYVPLSMSVYTLH